MASSTIGVRVDMTRSKQLRGQLDARGVRIVKKATFDIESGAKDRAPVDTGFMRDSIQSTFEDSGLTGIVYVGADYGIFQELGTRKMRAHPYLLPAFERVRASFKRAWDELVR